ncbi:MAG: hypothetical protein JXR75_13020 [Rhodobacteraceae bacterium]|nr:hypothetical protein [Paracoccaceae bacterium]
MNVIIGTVLIWGAALALLRHIARVDRAKLPEVWRAARATFLVMLPRTVIGLSGASFMAALLPRGRMAALFGPERGITGILLATVVGAATPGGPMVALALSATALKDGAGTGALLAYLTSWSIISQTRTLGSELALMGPTFLIRRLILSAPVPVMIGLSSQAIDAVW